MRSVREVEATQPPLREVQTLGGVTMPFGKIRVYAIAFDLDIETLRTVYPGPSFNNAYADIRRRLEDDGFSWIQGGVYYGNDATTPVTCVLAVQRLCAELPWFANAVRDIRMLRIEENNDLRPAIPLPSLGIE